MLVVEGPDGAGKSTLIKDLVRTTGLEVAPRVVSKDTEAMTDLGQWVDQNLTRGWQPLIFDRHRLISEPIYGPIVRDKLEEGFDNPKWFFTRLRWFYRINPILIYCLPPRDVVRRNVLHDSDNRVVREHINQVWGAYFNKAITDKTAGRAILYDYTLKGEIFVRDLITHRIQRELKERDVPTF